MKLGELLKDGILTRDWSKICTIYTFLTGEEISPPKEEVVIQPPNAIHLLDLDIPTENNADKKENITEELQATKSKKKKVQPAKIVNRKKVAQIEDDFIMSNQDDNDSMNHDDGNNDNDENHQACKKIPLTIKLPKKYINVSEKPIFKDDGVLFADEKGIGVTTVSRRVRDNSEIDVTCCRCGKVNTVSRALVISPSRYQCNKCCTGLSK